MATLQALSSEPARRVVSDIVLVEPVIILGDLITSRANHLQSSTPEKFSLRTPQGLLRLLRLGLLRLLRLRLLRLRLLRRRLLRRLAEGPSRVRLAGEVKPRHWLTEGRLAGEVKLLARWLT